MKNCVISAWGGVCGLGWGMGVGGREGLGLGSGRSSTLGLFILGVRHARRAGVDLQSILAPCGVPGPACSRVAEYCQLGVVCSAGDGESSYSRLIATPTWNWWPVAETVKLKECWLQVSGRSFNIRYGHFLTVFENVLTSGRFFGEMERCSGWWWWWWGVM